MPHDGAEFTQVPQPLRADSDAVTYPMGIVYDERFASRRDVPGIMLNEALDLATLLKPGTTNNTSDILSAIVARYTLARPEHERLAEEIVPHRDWGKASILDILVGDSTLPRQNVHATDYSSNTSYIVPESDDALAARREKRRQGLAHALSVTHEEYLLGRFEQALNQPDSDQITRLYQLAESVQQAEGTPRLHEDVEQLLGHFNDALAAPSDENQSRLGHILDTSIAALEKSDLSDLDVALLYRTAARSLHDLARIPGSLEKRMSEHDAREFRVRALEVAAEWMQQSGNMYRERFGQPIGAITTENYSELQAKTREANTYQHHIQETFWFEGVYAREYQEAVRTLTHCSVGQAAVLRAFTSAGHDSLTQPTDLPEQPVGMSDAR